MIWGWVQPSDDKPATAMVISYRRHEGGRSAPPFLVKIPLRGDGRAIEPFSYDGSERMPAMIYKKLPALQRERIASTRWSAFTREEGREAIKSDAFRIVGIRRRAYFSFRHAGAMSGKGNIEVIGYWRRGIESPDGVGDAFPDESNVVLIPISQPRALPGRVGRLAAATVATPVAAILDFGGALYTFVAFSGMRGS